MRVQGMETSSDHRCPAEMGIFNCDVVWAGYGGRQNSRFVVAKISRGGEDFPWHFSISLTARLLAHGVDTVRRPADCCRAVPSKGHVAFRPPAQPESHSFLIYTISLL